MIFIKSLTDGNIISNAQKEEIRLARLAANKQEEMFIKNGMLVGNAGLIPQDVYQEFDDVTVERFRADEGDVFLNDLMAMSRSVNIGKLVHKFRRASDAGNAQTSMSGQIGVKMDQVEYNYDGSLIPIHDTGFGRNWREWAAQQSEGFDALIDDQRESVSTLRRKVVDAFLDGHVDRDGNAIVLDGIGWTGMRNDSRVNQIDLGVGQVNFDFTDTSQTAADIKLNFLEIRDVMFITNNIGQDLTYYISREIGTNFERNWSENYDSRTILTELATLMGVREIKISSKLSGNELMGFPSDGTVRPVVGMGINTVAMPRPVYNSNYDFVVWGAVGFEVRNDYDGKSTAFFAQ